MMRGYIAEFGGKYCIWSEDKPQTELMDESDLIELLRADLQRDGIDLDMALHDSRMARVRQYGCSGGVYGHTKTYLLESNRAGPDGTHVETEEEIVRLYTRSDR